MFEILFVSLLLEFQSSLANHLDEGTQRFKVPKNDRRMAELIYYFFLELFELPQLLSLIEVRFWPPDRQ